jgi:hypothetical protein
VFYSVGANVTRPDAEGWDEPVDFPVFFLDTARRPELTCEQDVIGYVAQAFARLGFNPDKIIVSACEAPGVVHTPF